MSEAKIHPELIEELGISQLQQELHEEYVQKLKEMQATDHEVGRLRDLIKESQKPLLLTEGKTDVSILETAWDRLFPGIEKAFNIQSCDIYPPGDKNGGGAGCGILGKTLQCIRFDNPQLVIGLFDRDQEGIKSFKLDNNFIVTKSDTDVKKHRNGKAFAILLPTPPGMKAFADLDNLTIEFYFDEDDLKKEVDGKGLKWTFAETETKCLGKIIKKAVTTELSAAIIEKATKVHFAEKVVPTFGPSSFERFKSLFERIKQIIAGTTKA